MSEGPDVGRGCKISESILRSRLSRQLRLLWSDGGDSCSHGEHGGRRHGFTFFGRVEVWCELLSKTCRLGTPAEFEFGSKVSLLGEASL